MSRRVLFSLSLIGLMTTKALTQTDSNRPRAQEIGLVVRIFKTGILTSITDVNGIRVVHSMVIRSLVGAHLTVNSYILRHKESKDYCNA